MFIEKITKSKIGHLWLSKLNCGDRQNFDTSRIGVIVQRPNTAENLQQINNQCSTNIGNRLI